MHERCIFSRLGLRLRLIMTDHDSNNIKYTHTAINDGSESTVTMKHKKMKKNAKKETKIPYEPVRRTGATHGHTRCDAAYEWAKHWSLEEIWLWHDETILSIGRSWACVIESACPFVM